MRTEKEIQVRDLEPGDRVRLYGGDVWTVLSPDAGSLSHLGGRIPVVCGLDLRLLWPTVRAVKIPPEPLD